MFTYSIPENISRKSKTNILRSGDVLLKFKINNH